ncbi:MAG: O-antigen ligase family protein [Pirellulales bacterium]
MDWGLSAVILATPWFMGGRHPLGEFVLVVLAVLVATAWGARQTLMRGEVSWTRSPMQFILVAAVGLVLLQLAPLPQPMLRILSPRTAQLLPLWQEGGETFGLGTWNQVTMTPNATVAALVMLLAYGLLLIVAVQRIRRVEDVETILRWLAISVSLLAAFAIVQYLTSNGKFLWIYQHPFRDTHDAVKGPFTNKNHFAHLLALGIGPLIWLVHRTMSRYARDVGTFAATDSARPQHQLALILPLAALGLVLFAGLMTLSRGGAIAMFFATLVSVAALARARLLSKRLLLGLAGSFVLIAAALAIHGYQQVATRIGDFASGSIDSLDRYGQRRALWLADAKGCKDYYPLGSGIGSHGDVYPTYFDQQVELEFTHAENGPLQITLEAGAPGLVLLSIAVVLCGFWCVGTLRHPVSQRTYLCAAAVSASLAASVAHSFVDFVWYIPSLMAINVLLIACALRLWQFGRVSVEGTPKRRVAVSRWTCAAATAGVVLAGAWMIGNRFCATMASPHWDRYLAYALVREESTGRAPLPDQSVFDHLQQVLYWTPGDARAHFRLAQACLRRFDQLQKTAENAIPLSQIRDAAVQSRFANRAALDEWLSRAVGPQRRYLNTAWWHTRRGLQLCPLLGEAYVYLGDLCFLEGAPAAAKSAYIAQALKVRPYSGEVLLAGGSDAALSGNLELAVEYWRGALQKDRVVQIALTDLLVAYQVPMTFIIEQFQPQLPVVRLLVAKYAAKGLPDDQLRLLLEYYTQVGRSEASNSNNEAAAGLWLELYGVYRRLDEPNKMFDCLRRALDGNPNDYATRHTMATCLFEYRQFDEAEKQLHWCLHRRPEDKHLQEMLAYAVKQRVAQSGLPTNTKPAARR